MLPDRDFFFKLADAASAETLPASVWALPSPTSRMVVMIP